MINALLVQVVSSLQTVHFMYDMQRIRKRFLQNVLVTTERRPDRLGRY